MKKQFFFSMLTAAAMLASCTSEDAVDTSLNQYNMVEGQPAFINVGIAMPSASSSTRANGNDNTDNGATAEYAVKNGKLVLFKGSSEATATLFGSYDIPTDLAFADETGDYNDKTITSSSTKYVQEISSPNLTSGDFLYAYVILNTGNTTGIDLSTSQTFETFSKQVFKAIGIENEALGYGNEKTANGFVMTSVPYSTAAAGSNAPADGTECIALSKINASAVYDTKAAAEASTTTACIYVERAAVKVEVNFGTTITDPAGSATPVTLNGWGLGNVNNGGSTGSGYYNVRQTDNTWLQLYNEKAPTASTKYRFASVEPFFSSGHDMGYRTYWGTDVNYDGNSGLINGTVTDYSLASGDATFTYENTFNEDKQIYANTTYVGFKTTLNGGADFYTIDGANNTALNETNLLTKLASNVAAQKSTEIAAIQAKLESLVSAGTTFTFAPVAALGTYDSATGHVTYTVNWKLTVTAGQTQAEVEALEYETGKTVAQKMAETITGYTADVVNKYVGGVTYYAVRIAHFGDNETPWNTASVSYNNYDLIYPSTGVSNETPAVTYGASRKAAWLGRWGILRNNWYSLNVTGITGIGDAVPVDYSGTGTGEPGNTPDDNPTPKYYISAQIHILPWVKRTQSVTL